MSYVELTYFDNNLVFSKTWVNDKNEIHKEDGPAIVKFYENDEIRRIEYWFNGIRHRENKPAIIEYYKNRNKFSEIYLIDDLIHRIDGPAFIAYNIDGEIEQIEWCYNYKNYTDEVNNWLDENNFNSYKEMTDIDFNRMWMEIL